MTRQSARPATRRDFAQVETWVFDLDNTLYPHHLNLWQQVDARIRGYVANYLALSHDDAFRLQKDYYKRYGSTMRGMMIEHGMDPDAFLDFVHQIDHSPACSRSGARQRDRKTARPQADPHQRHPQARRSGDAPPRDRPPFRGRLRHRRRRPRAQAAAAGVRPLPGRHGVDPGRPPCSRISPAISKCRTRSA